MMANTRITMMALAVCAIVLAAGEGWSSPPKGALRPAGEVRPAGAVRRAGCCGDDGGTMPGYGVLADPGHYGTAPDVHAAPGHDLHGAMPAPFPGMPDMHGPTSGPMPMPGPLAGSEMGPMHGPIVGPLPGGGGRGGGPPPGTVGLTYRRATRLVPSDKHPRAGMVDVSVEGAYDVDAEGMKAYRATDGIWRLETKEPLIPGLPHIYHIRATLGPDDDSPTQYRTVRLIPGRIIDLQW